MARAPVVLPVRQPVPGRGPVRPVVRQPVVQPEPQPEAEPVATPARAPVPGRLPPVARQPLVQPEPAAQAVVLPIRAPVPGRGGLPPVARRPPPPRAAPLTEHEAKRKRHRTHHEYWDAAEWGTLTDAELAALHITRKPGAENMCPWEPGPAVETTYVTPADDDA